MRDAWASRLSSVGAESAVRWINPAFQTANLTVGNDANAPAPGNHSRSTGCRVKMRLVHLTGAGCEAQLDDQPVWTGWRAGKAGQRLTRCIDRFTGCVTIWRWQAVLLIAGGDGDRVVPSPSPVSGGLEGRLLRRMAIGWRRVKPSRQFSGPQGMKQLLWGIASVRCRGRNTVNSVAPRKAFWRSPWQLSHKVIAWAAIVCRDNR